MIELDVLIPTCNRTGALAITLTSLALQRFLNFNAIVSDQSEQDEIGSSMEVQTAINVLRSHGNQVEIYRNIPRRGMAEQRQFLLSKATCPYALFLDDDLILEPYVVGNLITAIKEEKCGFVGCAVVGLSYMDNVRPDEQTIEFWESPVEPESIRIGSTAWDRFRLHNAANLFHVEKKLGLTPERPRKFRIAWVGGCVLYDSQKLRSAGGFHFWRELPPNHCGEDVLAQLRVMARFGGCGLIPSGVYHLELPTTIQDREVDAPIVLQESESR